MGAPGYTSSHSEPDQAAAMYSLPPRLIAVRCEAGHSAEGRDMFRRNGMKNTIRIVLLAAAVLIPLAVYAQIRPGNPTTSTVITKAEIDTILATEMGQTTRDEHARVVDIGDGWSMELGIIHRAKQKVMTDGEARW